MQDNDWRGTGADRFGPVAVSCGATLFRSNPVIRLLIAAGVVLVVGVVLWFVWLGPELANGRSERAAVQGLAGYDAAETTWSGRVLILQLKDADDAALQKLSQIDLPELRILRLRGCTFTPGGLSTLQSFTQIVELDLQGTPVDEAGRDVLAALKHLERLNVRQTGLKFDDVQKLEQSLPDASLRY